MLDGGEAHLSDFGGHTGQEGSSGDAHLRPRPPTRRTRMQSTPITAAKCLAVARTTGLERRKRRRLSVAWHDLLHPASYAGALLASCPKDASPDPTACLWPSLSSLSYSQPPSTVASRAHKPHGGAPAHPRPRRRLRRNDGEKAKSRREESALNGRTCQNPRAPPPRSRPPHGAIGVLAVHAADLSFASSSRPGLGRRCCTFGLQLCTCLHSALVVTSFDPTYTPPLVLPALVTSCWVHLPKADFIVSISSDDPPVGDRSLALARARPSSLSTETRLRARLARHVLLSMASSPQRHPRTPTDRFHFIRSPCRTPTL